MRTVRCPECSEPVAAFVDTPPAGLPFSNVAALVEVDHAVRRHRRHCVAEAYRLPSRLPSHTTPAA